jgi:adenosylcobyric acid synthase
MAKALMLQGTASNVGKSVLTAALGRIFYQDGWKVVPFKSQNMALNSYATLSGGEMGRAQAMQAQACCLLPEVEMNPVLLKPTSNKTSQVILLGRPVGNMTAIEYFTDFNATALKIIAECLAKYRQQYEIVLIEGAGSPAEVNLKQRDIANMLIAKMAEAPVILIADIDRGGALASIVGTLELLDPDERNQVAGILINKFRGDISLLKSALDFLEQKTGKPVLGVIPYLKDLHIPQEDSVSLDEFVDHKRPSCSNYIEIAIIKLPRISNFTDFEPFLCEPDVHIRYVQDAVNLGHPDLIIIPGSKNTIEDLIFLEQTGLTAAILQAVNRQIPLIGICGGFQMLGESIGDPHGLESSYKVRRGLGLIPMTTELYKEKITTQVTALIGNNIPWLKTEVGKKISGYEIHMGRTRLYPGIIPAFILNKPAGSEIELWDGAIMNEGMIFGTYLHGIFENDVVRWCLLNWLREKRGLNPLEREISYLKNREDHYNILANTVRQNIDLAKVYQILGVKK